MPTHVTYGHCYLLACCWGGGGGGGGGCTYFNQLLNSSNLEGVDSCKVQFSGNDFDCDEWHFSKFKDLLNNLVVHFGPIITLKCS